MYGKGGFVIQSIARYARTLLLAAGLVPLAAAAYAQGTAPQIKGTPVAAPKASPVAHPELMDINSATEDELKTLPGIDVVYAGKIVAAGRPYKNKTELLTRKIVPQATYQKIRYKIIAKQS
jgi:competence protein ComEA